jgi:hypothetical protein
MSQRSKAASVLIGLAAIGLAIVSPVVAARVYANGFTVPAAKGVVGPYEYTVGVWPSPPTVGNLHLSIALKESKRPVTNAVVSVTGSLASTTVGPVQATSFLDSQTYELNMPLSSTLSI